jgi:hypothetical protein
VIDPDSPNDTLARSDFDRMKGISYLLLDPDTFAKTRPRRTRSR